MGNASTRAVSIAVRTTGVGMLATYLCACGAAPLSTSGQANLAPAAPPPRVPSALDVALTEAGQAWEQRADPASLQRAVELWRQSLALPGAVQQDLELRLAEAHHFMGTALLSQGRDPQAATAAFEAGVEASVAAGAGSIEAAPSEALYWWARNRASAAGQTDYAGSLLVQHDVLTVMRRCAEANCEYDHGGAHRFLGSHHARPLGFPHRDLTLARGYFERAIALDPGHLLTRVAFARDYAVAAQDRSLFEQQVRFVIEASPGAPAASRGDALLAQHQAEALLRAAPNLFE